MTYRLVDMLLDRVSRQIGVPRRDQRRGDGQAAVVFVSGNVRELENIWNAR